MIKVSVVIPVYNSGIYLEKCLNSIINQTEENIEIIIINDGSTDNSEVVIQKYLKFDKRIVYIKQDNKGVSNARNIGIQQSKGNYIMFVDSDDYVEIQTISELYDLAIENDADVVRAGYKCQDNIVVTKNEFKTNIYQHIIDTYDFSSSCNQIIKTDIIKKNNILFDEDIKYGEDALYNMKLYLCANKVVLTPKIYYNYIENLNGATRKNDLNAVIKKCNDIILVYNELYKYVELYDLNNLKSNVSIRILTEVNSVLKEFYNKKINISFRDKVSYIKKVMNDERILNCINKLENRKFNQNKINRLLILLIIKRKPIVYSIISLIGYKIKKLKRKK